ncbi:corazonin [Calliopsis andreniformis]|uniref:corazonin n=1 Tax=Calliopsis andreniformis TaxID=337506 RepID=UPI003FCDDCF7
MAFTYLFTLLVLSMAMATVFCQTFQYSHGWTNGKRSSPMLEELVNSADKNAGQLDNVLVNCELQKLKLLLQGNVNSQLLQIPCELFTSPKRSFSETMTNVDHFRRQPAPASNNY